MSLFTLISRTVLNFSVLNKLLSKRSDVEFASILLLGFRNIPSVSKASCVLKTQLNIGGKLICPCGDQNKQSLVFLEKLAKDNYKETIHDSVLFVPMLSGKIQD